ncbi:zinc finger CCCH domain-containing protein 20-like [Rutidosis leptorrhynchoides]|uniref:zinc finger CCCH domain-containing protein 20-like n=1 Tax=Rutidosis leptorrhynchoides TaxID=125765 RepID=UPI003A98D1FC
MMVGEHPRPNPAVHVPPWSMIEDPSADVYSLYSPSVKADGNANDPNKYCIQEALAAFQRFLPSIEPDMDSDPDFSGLESDSAIDAYSCDHFRMFEFKVRRCARGRSHDWTECPYAHPGEKARRRDPRKYHYSGTACPDYRKGTCRKGDSCEFAHGVFECWLHPARYRTQPCKDGRACKRPVCFFAHTAEQLRVLPQQSPRSVNSPIESYDGSPMRQAFEASCTKSLPFLSSPGSISPPQSPREDSPPMSPMTVQSLSRSPGSHSINDMVASLRNMQLSKVKSLPSSWNMQVVTPSSPTGYGSCSSGYGSPRGSILRPGFSSLPSTPTWNPTRPHRYSELWDNVCEEEPAMERVESGRDLRVKMFAKLREENSLGRVEPGMGQSSNTPDVDWISELVN